jgi:hypothetical protein
VVNVKLAIIGSKRTKFSNPKAVEMLEAFLDHNMTEKPEEVILAGCPMNRDSWVRDYLLNRQIKFAEYDPPGPLGMNSRNQRLADDCNEMWAFWSGDSGSNTLAIARIAKNTGKPVRLFVVKDTIEELKEIPQ